MCCCAASSVALHILSYCVWCVCVLYCAAMRCCVWARASHSQNVINRINCIFNHKRWRRRRRRLDSMRCFCRLLPQSTFWTRARPTTKYIPNINIYLKHEQQQQRIVNARYALYTICFKTSIYILYVRIWCHGMQHHHAVILCPRELLTHDNLLCALLFAFCLASKHIILYTYTCGSFPNSSTDNCKFCPKLDVFYAAAITYTLPFSNIERNSRWLI